MWRWPREASISVHLSCFLSSFCSYAGEIGVWNCLLESSVHSRCCLYRPAWPCAAQAVGYIIHTSLQPTGEGYCEAGGLKSLHQSLGHLPPAWEEGGSFWRIVCFYHFSILAPSDATPWDDWTTSKCLFPGLWIFHLSRLTFASTWLWLCLRVTTSKCPAEDRDQILLCSFQGAAVWAVLGKSWIQIWSQVRAPGHINGLNKGNSLEVTTSLKLRSSKIISFPVISPMLPKGMQLACNCYGGTPGSWVIRN